MCFCRSIVWSCSAFLWHGRLGSMHSGLVVFVGFGPARALCQAILSCCFARVVCFVGKGKPPRAPHRQTGARWRARNAKLALGGLEACDLTMLTCRSTPSRFVLRELEDERMTNFQIQPEAGSERAEPGLLRVQKRGSVAIKSTLTQRRLLQYKPARTIVLYYFLVPRHTLDVGEQPFKTTINVLLESPNLNQPSLEGL